MLSITGLPDEKHFFLYECGHDAEKRAAVELNGLLQAAGPGYLLLSVPTAMVRGVFDALHEPGITFPSEVDGLRAGIVVMTPDELESVGGAGKISERGKPFRYQLGDLQEMPAKGWAGISACWHLRVKSPELAKLRKSYGLPEKIEGQSDFSIVVACRKVGVLSANAVSKVEHINPSILPAWTRPN
jgi:hypothetical protein